MTHDVFICHSSEDRVVADAICAHLEQAKIRCWIAPRDVLPGSDYAQSIVEAIGSSKLAVLVFSEHSNTSAHVHREIERCVGHGIAILPFRLSAVPPSPSLEYFISNAHWLDAVTPPLQQHIDHLVGTVRLLLDRATAIDAAQAQPLPPPTAMSAPTPSAAPQWAAPPAPVAAVPAMPTAPPRRSRTGLWLALGGVGVGALLLGAVLVFRGDGGDESTGSTPAVTTTRRPAPSTVTTSPQVPPVAPSTSLAPSTTRDVVPTTPPESALLQGPVDVLDQFAFDLAITVSWDGGAMTLNSTGIYVAPADQMCTMSGTLDGITFSTTAVIVGDEAWYDDGFGGGFVATDPDDRAVTGLLSSCPTSHQMWGEDFEEAPPGGTEVTVDGMKMFEYDVTELASAWGQFFGLPSGLTADEMIIRVSPDRTWVAGMDATLSGSADTFRSTMGVPPEGIDGDCELEFSLQIRQPNDPDLVVLSPV